MAPQNFVLNMEAPPFDYSHFDYDKSTTVVEVSYLSIRLQEPTTHFDYILTPDFLFVYKKTARLQERDQFDYNLRYLSTVEGGLYFKLYLSMCM